mgnify:CR=1 FL=1
MTKYAILIGINYNNNYELRLRGCINDIININNLLIDAYGYKKENIIQLRDDNIGINPTKENIEKILEYYLDKLKINDELWIHYSGHGSYIYDNNNDEIDNRDEVLIPVDIKTNGYINDDYLYKLLNNSKCKIYLTMDCCHSGTLWDLPYLYNRYNNRIYRFRTNKPLRNKNIFMLSGSRDNQYSYDSFNTEQQIPMGAFTKGLIYCIRENNHNCNLLYLKDDINIYLKKNNYSQTSQYTSSNDNPNIYLTRVGLQNNEKTEKIINNNMISIIYRR